MAAQDKVVLLNDIENILKPRMFANLLEEATTEINSTLNDYDITRLTEAEASEDFLEAFLAAKKVEGKSEETITQYGYIIRSSLKAMNVSVKNLTTAHLRAYFEAELARGISPSTIKHKREIFSSFYAWLLAEHLVLTNPINGIAAIKVEQVVRPAYSMADMERLKRSCANKRDAAILAVLNSTFCRVGELCKLDIKDINFQTGEIVVRGKGNKQRTVLLDEVAIMLLKEYLASRDDDNPALFLNRLNKRLQKGGVRVILNRIADTAGVEHVHPHRFRRTTITKLLNRGMPIQNVAILAGHSKIDTTMRYYYASSENIKLEYKKYSI